MVVTVNVLQQPRSTSTFSFNFLQVQRRGRGRGRDNNGDGDAATSALPPGCPSLSEPGLAPPLPPPAAPARRRTSATTTRISVLSQCRICPMPEYLFFPTGVFSLTLARDLLVLVVRLALSVSNDWGSQVFVRMAAGTVSPLSLC